MDDGAINKLCDQTVCEQDVQELGCAHYSAGTVRGDGELVWV